MLNILDPSDKRWMDFISSIPQANIFHHPAWVNLIADSYGYRPFIVAIMDSNERITAGLPIVEINSRLTGNRWVSLSFTDHCHPLYRDKSSLRQLVDGLIVLYQDEKIPKMELRWGDKFPQDGYVHANNVLHVIALDPDSGVVASKFNKMHRRNIQVAKKNDVRIEIGTSQKFLDQYFQLHLDTRKRQGVPSQPKHFFELVKNNIINKDLGFILLAFKNRECIAGSIYLHWNNTLIYKYGASKKSGLKLRPNNLLFWFAIKWGCENGYSTLDLGKTEMGNVGLREFKQGWGSEETTLSYTTFAKSPPSKGSGKMMDIVEVVIKNSPRWVCRATGEIFYRYFG